MNRRAITCRWLLSAAMLAIAGCHCAWPEDFCISPDGATVAFLAVDASVYPSPERQSRISQSVKLCWASLAWPSDVRSVPVAQWGRDRAEQPLEQHVHLCFSPDSRRIAVVAPGAAMIVDLETGRQRPVARSGDAITSFAWIDRTHVGYVALHPRSRAGPAGRIVWIECVEGEASRKAVYRELYTLDEPLGDRQEFVFSWPREAWSPTGSHVLFNDEQGLRLLEVASGELQTVGTQPAEDFSWSNDGRAVVWRERGNGDSIRLLRLETGELTDLTPQFRRIFGNARPQYAGRWTPDDQFLLFPDTPQEKDGEDPVAAQYGGGGALIRLDPWEVVPLGKMAAQARGGKPLELCWQAAAGLLVGGRAAEAYVVDYAGRTRDLPGDVDTTMEWRITPDGRKAVTVDKGLQVHVVEIGAERGSAEYRGG